jgi:hypothetical protein
LLPPYLRQSNASTATIRAVPEGDHSANDNTVSVIALMDTVKVGPLPHNTVELPKGGLIPISWNIVTVWYATEEDVDVTYEERHELVASNGMDMLNDQETFLGANPVIGEFRFTRMGERTTPVHAIFNFPVSVEGPCRLRLLLRG